MKFTTEAEVRAFLRLCLAPRPGHERTPAQLAEIMPEPLYDALVRYAPHLRALRTDVDRLNTAARIASGTYADALAAWIAAEPEPHTVYQVPGDGHDHWLWQCPKETGGCDYQTPWYSPTREDAQAGYDIHLTQCRARQTGVSALCPQNRVGDKAEPGEHFYKPGAGGITRCVFCGTPALWGGEPGPEPHVPEYVFNADSVNRTTKHAAVDGFTLCPRAFRASKPMPVEEAARLALCGGCRQALTGQTS